MVGRWRKASSIIYLASSFFGVVPQRSTRITSHISVPRRSFTAKPVFCGQYISFSNHLQEIQLEVTNSEEEKKTLSSVKAAAKDPPGYVNMRKLFKERKDLCFQNFLEPPQLQYFSGFAQDIFSKIVTISFFQVQQGFHFKFDPSGILVKHDNGDVIDVAVPLSQLCKGGCHFSDEVTGPFAAMLSDMFLTDFKEVSDLLNLANVEPNWSNLKDIHGHPLFWSAEMKVAALIVAQIYLSPGTTAIKHGLTNVPSRIRKFSFANFKKALSNNNFYERAYFVNQDYKVSFVPIVKDWSQFFITEYACFHKDYRKKKGFGLGGNERHHEMLTFSRNSVGHFGDENMDGIAHELRLKSVNALVTGLDRTFGLSLMIYHSLRELGQHSLPLSVEFSN